MNQKHYTDTVKHYLSLSERLEKEAAVNLQVIGTLCDEYELQKLESIELKESISENFNQSFFDCSHVVGILNTHLGSLESHNQEIKSLSTDLERNDFDKLSQSLKRILSEKRFLIDHVRNVMKIVQDLIKFGNILSGSSTYNPDERFDCIPCETPLKHLDKIEDWSSARNESENNYNLIGEKTHPAIQKQRTIWVRKIQEILSSISNNSSLEDQKTAYISFSKNLTREISSFCEAIDHEAKETKEQLVAQQNRIEFEANRLKSEKRGKTIDIIKSALFLTVILFLILLATNSPFSLYKFSLISFGIYLSLYALMKNSSDSDIHIMSTLFSGVIMLIFFIGSLLVSTFDFASSFFDFSLYQKFPRWLQAVFFGTFKESFLMLLFSLLGIIAALILPGKYFRS